MKQGGRFVIFKKDKMTNYSKAEIQEKFDNYNGNTIPVATDNDLESLEKAMATSTKTVSEIFKEIYATLQPGYYKKIGNIEYKNGTSPTHCIRVLYFSDFETDDFLERIVNIGPLVNVNAVAKLSQDDTARGLWDEFSKEKISGGFGGNYYKVQKERFFNKLFAHTDMFYVHSLDTATEYNTCVWSTIV